MENTRESESLNHGSIPCVPTILIIALLSIAAFPRTEPKGLTNLITMSQIDRHEWCLYGPLQIHGQEHYEFMEIDQGGYVCWYMEGDVRIALLPSGLVAYNENGDFVPLVTWEKNPEIQEFNYGVH